MNKHRYLCVAAVTVCALLELPQAFAYPIPPVPLWRQVQESDAVIVAEVIAVVEPSDEELAKRDADGNLTFRLATAKLRVIERWKGSIEENVAVPFEHSLVCPAPPHFALGRTVLAFLQYDREEARWVTSHLSYGTLYPTLEERKVFKVRVQEAAGLQRTAPVNPNDLLEWQISCAEQSATRWHGLYELSGSPKPPLYEDEEPRQRATVLSDAHKKRLADGFKRDPSLDDVTAIVQILAGYQDPSLDRALVAVVDKESGASEPDIYEFRDAMVALLDRAGAPDADNLVPELSFKDDSADLEALQKAWAVVKETLDRR